MFFFFKFRYSYYHISSSETRKNSLLVLFFGEKMYGNVEIFNNFINFFKFDENYCIFCLGGVEKMFLFVNKNIDIKIIKNNGNLNTRKRSFWLKCFLIHI